MSNVRRTDHVPHDRLTRLANVAVDAIEADGEHEDGDRAIILLDDGTKGGIVLHGYHAPEDVIADLVAHIRAIAESSGIDVRVIIAPEVHDG